MAKTTCASTFAALGLGLGDVNLLFLFFFLWPRA